MENQPGQQPATVQWTESKPAANQGGKGAGRTSSESGFAVEKESVTQKEIFVFAKWILAVSSAVYLLLIILHIFDWTGLNKEAMQDVWDKMTVFLNSIITLVLGLYFGAKKDDFRRAS